MNHRQFFQGVVAVVVMPEVKPPLMPKLYRSGVRYYDVGSAYPAAMMKEHFTRIVRDIDVAVFKGGRIEYFDTDGVIIVTRGMKPSAKEQS